MLHAIIEKHGFIPFWKRTFKGSCSSDTLFEPHFHECVGSFELKMFIVVDLFLISALVLESIEECVAMHIDAGLLSEEALSVVSKTVEKIGCDLSNILHFEFVFFFLKVLNSIIRKFPDGHIFGRAYMKINF